MAQGKQFGPFILERMIGRGGMGAVYRATHETTGQVVAVKALLLPLEQERERFEAEISTLKLLRHENIVKLYGFGQEDGILYYAMEYVDGPSLSTLLKRGRRFTWEEVVYIGESICRALKHAHDRGVVHRDIKPANILLLDDGVVKVSDYGIAQYFGNSRLTNANQVVGTIEFMAPEQAQAGAVTPKTDMYSLGALMYALLTGKPPYVASSLPELLKKYRQSSPEPARLTRPEIPKIVDQLLFDLLQIQPEKRPGDARVFGRRLQALLASSPNCVDGNPFLRQKIASSTSSDSLDLATSSRVDLENPSETTMAKASDDDGTKDFKERGEDHSPDFPYQSIYDESQDGPQNDPTIDFESPFDKTTERATGVEKTIVADGRNARPEELRDDFVVNDPNATSSANASIDSSEKFADSETSTGEVKATFLDDAPETGPSETPASSSDATDSASETIAAEYDYALEGEQVPPRALSDDSRAETLGFDLAFGGTTSTRDSSVAETLTRSSVALRGAPTAGKRKEKSDVVLQGVGAKDARKNSATTVCDAPSANATPQAAKKETPASDVPSVFDRSNKNVPFEELGELPESLEATPLEKFKKSQFTPVEEDELGDLPQAEEEDHRPLARIRVLVLGFIFAATIVGITLALRAPSADSLYKQIDRDLSRAPNSKFNDALKKSEEDMRRFMTLYPNDERTRKIDYFLCVLETNDLEQRLERRIANPSRNPDAARGPNPENLPIGRIYLEARRVSSDNWELGERKLLAFIELYGAPAIEIDSNESDSQGDADERESDSGDGKKAKKKIRAESNPWKKWEPSWPPLNQPVDRFVEIARRRLVELRKQMETFRSDDVTLLTGKLDSLKDRSPEDAERIRRATVALYGDLEWAQEALKNAFETPTESDEETSVPDDAGTDASEAAPTVEESSTLNESSESDS